MRWWTECSVNKLNARCHRTFPLHTSLPRIPHRQVAAGMPFLGWPWRCHGPSPWSMEGGEGKGECTGLCLLHFSLRASLSLYPISQPPAPLQTEASPPHPRSGPWDEFSRLLILLGRVSFQPGSGILQENNIESSRNLCQHHHNDITVMHVPGSRSGLCVLLIYPSNNLMK